MKWIASPDPRLELRGLPWFSENAPDLWRLPKSAKDRTPKGAWSRSLCPDGGRIRFSSDTSRLAIRAQAAQEHVNPCMIDLYVDGRFLHSVDLVGAEPRELTLFDKKERAPKDITVYLPHTHEIRVLAFGVDEDAHLAAPKPFALERPLVCYGSSVLQGTGANHPSMTYPAILARRLNLDLVNLGFGGSGKAEPEVVALVNQLDACCYLFDLGKSYGAQSIEVYGRMLDTIRAGHPDVPIIVITPIYSTKEVTEAGYEEKSENLRTLMRQAAADRAKAGDTHMFVVEGLELFGAGDVDAFHDSLHPNDQGDDRMAMRLAPIVEKTVFGKEAGAKR
ncbi:MAG: GDSL-type esterase/lipase family protein [Candidatus Sumerlaeota bacterium]|nr:GDSL-type esterase/lipase family protein [Candidatus Sumerlaeota bacterium]